MIESVVRLRWRTAATLWITLVGVAAGAWLVYSCRQVLAWIAAAAILALAANPLVRRLQSLGVRRRSHAVGIVVAGGLVIVSALGALFLPTLISQVNDLVNKAPTYVAEATQGKGPLGFLEVKYHVVEHARQAVSGGGGVSVALGATQTVVSGVTAVVTIGFLTIFILLEGPAVAERFFGILRPDAEARWRVLGAEVQRIVGGYVAGNLLISLIAGSAATAVLFALGVPFPLALGLLVAVLDLIPLAGATIAAVILAIVALTHSTTAAIVVVAYFAVYQLIENHVLQPLVYGRTVQTSPLTALVAVLIGASVAGILGALAAIPVAASLEVVASDYLDRRRRLEALPAANGEPALTRRD
jgi:predicted PurR-regulated permease PerM